MAITAYSKARRFLSTKLTPPDDEQHALKDLKGRALSSIPCLLCILLSPAEDAHHLYLHWSWCGAWWAITPTHSTHKIVTRWQSNWGKEQRKGDKRLWQPALILEGTHCKAQLWKMVFLFMPVISFLWPAPASQTQTCREPVAFCL